MGMACDAEGGQAALPDAPERPAGAAAAGGMNAEETAMILTSLSKCQFGDGPRASMTATAAATTTTTRAAAGGGSSSGDSDLEGFSDDEQSPHFRGRVSRVQQINFDGPEGSKLDFTDEAGLSHRFRNESNRVKSMVTKHISIDELRAHFDRPIIDVAKDFGICITLMKKICRRNGIKRWPHRQIRSLSKSIASMEAAMLSAHGGERDKYRDQIQNLRLKRESVIADPNKDSAGKGDAAMSAGDLPLYHAPATSLRPHHHVSAAPKLSPRPTASSPGAMAFKTENGGAPPHSKGGRWTSDEHAAFLEGIRLYGKDWRRVAQVVRTRSAVQTRTHAQKYLLKFAGRFPFDGPDGTGAGLTSSAPSGGRQSDDVTMLSPTETSASAVMTTPASDDSASSSGSWNADEASVKPVSEAMAMILNTSPALQPEAEPEPEEEPTPRYPRALELEMGPSKVASASAL